MLVKVSSDIAVDPEMVVAVTTKTEGIERRYAVTILHMRDGRVFTVTERPHEVMEKLGVK